MKESAVSFIAAEYGVPVESVAADDKLRELAELCCMMEDLSAEELRVAVVILIAEKRRRVQEKQTDTEN